MAAISSGRAPGPSRRKAKPTQTEKHHRYESFTKRVSRLKIDPVHTIQRSRIVETDNDLSQSYFRTALDEWAELNLTATFTSFLNKASPLSESLPQLLHHADQVVDLLLDHIDRQDALAQEAFMSLVAHLAHDLGQTFEKYFCRIVQVVTHTAIAQDDPVVIEACFTCLAWTYKYLSRLLVHNLGPLLDMLLPYFGAKREYMRRFTAESLAFLVRKTATLYPKDPRPLRTALEHIFNRLRDVQGSKEAEPFRYAVMTLLVESMVGVDAGLHSSAASLLACACDVCGTDQDLNVAGIKTVEGTVVNLVHKTDAVGFEPLNNVIVDLNLHNTDLKAPAIGNLQMSRLQTRLLLVVLAARNGTRTSNWTQMLNILIEHFNNRSLTFQDPTIKKTLSRAASAAIHNAPLSSLLPQVRTLVDSLAGSLSPTQFFSFCETSARLQVSRFQDLLLPLLQEYIIKHFLDPELTNLTLLYTQLHSLGCVHGQTSKQGYTLLMPNLELKLQTLIHSKSTDQHSLHFQKAMLLNRSIHYPRDGAFGADRKSERSDALNDSSPVSSLSTRIELGWILESLASKECLGVNFTQHDLSKLLEQPEERYKIQPVLRATTTLLLKSPNRSLHSLPPNNRLVRHLTNNMLNLSTDIRKQSLLLLRALHTGDKLSQIGDTCNHLIEILNTDYSIANARQLSMLIRRLPQKYRETSNDEVGKELVPYFCLGILSDYHDTVRRDACSVLGEIMDDQNLEEIVLEVLKDWLKAPTPISKSDENQNTDADRITEFECNRMRAIELSEEESEQHYLKAEQEIRDIVERAHAVHNAVTPSESRQIALQVLLAIPQVAERRSKILVPAFLTAYQTTANHILMGDESGSTNTLSPDIDHQTWTLKERKMFLELISKFNNPRMLYRSEEIYQVLLELLTNGDPGVRTLAVQAVMKWKDKTLNAHKGALVQVAEDKQTTTDLALLLSSDENSSVVKPDDRPHLIPILLRLVFGQLIGRGGGHGSQEAKRKSLLRLVFRMDVSEVKVFMDILLGRLREVNASSFSSNEAHSLLSTQLGLDQQYGFLRMVMSMVSILQTQFSPHGSSVLPAVLYCTAGAASQISVSQHTEGAPALLRNIRRTGLQCLTSLFRYCTDIAWTLYMPFIYSMLVKPRIQNFTAENAQSVSGLLQLFAAWSQTKPGLECLRYDSDIALSAVLDLLRSDLTKSEVKIFILEEIISTLLKKSENFSNDGEAFKALLRIQATTILTSIADLLSQSPSKPLLQLSTRVLQMMSSHANETSVSLKIVVLLMRILEEPSQRIPPHIKGSTLKAIEGLAAHSNVFQQPDLRDDFLRQLSTYFDYFKDAANRTTCCQLLQHLAEEDLHLVDIAAICADMNSFSNTSLDYMDHDRRSTAFAATHQLLEQGPFTRTLVPIVYNLLFFIRSSTDTAIRGNALSCLKHSISKVGGDEDTSQLLQKLLFTAVRKYIKDDSEVVRADFVEALGAMVKYWKSSEQLQNMAPLLVGDDEEASFFTNILHIQQHRRTRAMRRLTTEVEKGCITADNISEIFLPLLQKYAQDTSGEDSVLTIKGQATASMLVLFQWLEWSSFRKIFRQYRQALDHHSDDGKIDVRLLSHAADALNTAVKQKRVGGVEEQTTPHLAASLPPPEIIAQEVRKRFIPKLAELSHYKDEGEATERIPAAVVAIKLIRLLPQEELTLTAAPIVLDIAQVLRSRTQETRDLARKKLADIVVQLGPSSMQFVLKELRTALTRGYQLHVLSYTVHTILLTTAETREIGDLDYCVEDLVKVIMDDVFGSVGQEKDNQDYTSSMKEVKSNKSFDSMEILAMNTSLKHMFKLVTPFESLLTGSLTTRQVRHADELLRRIGVGVSHNSSAETQEVLVFAFELINSFYKAKPPPASRPQTLSEKNRERFLIQKEPASKTRLATTTSSLYKLAKFAIDIARSTFARHSELLKASNVHGFVPIIGDALTEGQEDVKISALRLLSTVVKVHLPELEENAELYVREAVRVVKSSTNTNEEAAQAALKLVASILREKQSVKVRDSDISYLLQRTMPDLEEPDKQGVTFNFVKAVMVHRIQLPEIYELVDKIGLMMVTSQSGASRDAARGVYVHFLLDYPQGKTRWSKQIKFLVKNLDYQYPEGRMSVMEATHVLIGKVDQNTAKELASVMFVPLILSVANDEHAKCREMAGALLAQMFARTFTSVRSTMREPLVAWLEQRENPTLRKISAQAWSIYFEAVGVQGRDEIEIVLPHIEDILQSHELDADDWEMTFQALSLMVTLTRIFPKYLLSGKQSKVWTLIVTLLGTTHSWLQDTTSQLLGLYLNSCIESDSMSVPLSCGYGLNFDAGVIIQIVRSSVRLLRRPETNDDLATKVLQNLLYLVRCADKSSTKLQLQYQNHENADNKDHSDDNEDGLALEHAHKHSNDINGESELASIPVTKYILDQATYILRREPPKQTSANLQPKLSFLKLTTALLPHITTPTSLSLTQLLVPLLHYTNPSTIAPRSSDSEFAAKWQQLIEEAQLCMDAIESSIGEREYPKLVSEATKVARGRRQERRTKRALEVINDPEKAGKEKRRKFEQKKRREKEVRNIHKATRRRGMGL